jgi:serine palmitoyltransferase
MDLERRIQKFMDSEDAVLYSYGFVTISSAIATFSGRGDLLIVDDGVSYSVQTGVRLSRSDVIWYKHNDMQDLEKKLKQVEATDRKTKKKLYRRFIVFEGVFYNHGDLAPLPKIKALADEYKYRTIMDDSCGIGAIGKTGRGTCEYYGVPVKSIDILCADLATTVSSVGGFCCGDKSIIFHQRLNSSGYVYSCSLPPLLATSAIAAFDIIDEKGPQLLSQLASNVEFLHQGLSKIKGVVITSKPQTPIIHMRLSNRPPNRLDEEKVLQNIVDQALANNVLITRAKYVHNNEVLLPSPSIRLCGSSVFSKQQLTQAIQAIEKAVQVVLQQQPESDQEEDDNNTPMSTPPSTPPLGNKQTEKKGGATKRTTKK